jgi:hypothetical protein
MPFSLYDMFPLGVVGARKEKSANIVASTPRSQEGGIKLIQPACETIAINP